MVLYNAKNERIKRDYLEWEKEANGKSDKTIVNMRSAIYRFEQSTQFKDFRLISKDIIISFKKELTTMKNNKSNQPVSKTYLLHTSKYLINFFRWLASQKGYKKKLNLSVIAYFKLSDRDIKIAGSDKSKRFPTINQVERVVQVMPTITDIEKRNRALIAFLILTGIRVSAIASLKLKHVMLS